MWAKNRSKTGSKRSLESIQGAFAVQGVEDSSHITFFSVSKWVLEGRKCFGQHQMGPKGQSAKVELKRKAFFRYTFFPFLPKRRQARIHCLIIVTSDKSGRMLHSGFLWPFSFYRVLDTYTHMVGEKCRIIFKWTTDVGQKCCVHSQKRKGFCSEIFIPNRTEWEENGLTFVLFWCTFLVTILCQLIVNKMTGCKSWLLFPKCYNFLLYERVHSYATTHTIPN